MTVLPIRTIGDPVLRTPAAPVTAFDRGLEALVQDMVETMFDVGGVGLAAPQVGVGLRLFVYGLDGPQGPVGHVVNPVLEVSEEEQEGGEGCLSLPGLHSETPRRRWARATGTDLAGEPVAVEGEGLLARCLQHECDHLEGMLYVDRLQGEHRKALMRQIRSAGFQDQTRTVAQQRAATTSTGFSGAAFGPGASSAAGGRH